MRRLCVLLVAVTAIAVLPAAHAEAKTFTFFGRAWGHGMGMSQWGAKGLAERGKSTAQILAHYYRGTSLETKSAPAEIRVGLLQEQSAITVKGDGAFDLFDKNGTKRATPDPGEIWKIDPNSGGKLDVFAPGASKPKFTSSAPVTIRYEKRGTIVTLPQTGHRYKRGRIDVDINPATGKARAIAIVNFEQYLYGLGEMPSSWHTEALKAQAIAGRTYALEKITRAGQNRSVCNCGVYASTADQAYVGVAHELQRWTDAVKATAGRVVTYQGKPIQALYSSASGGHTEHNDKVTGGAALPYLRGVCDPGDYNGGANPHSNWVVKFSDTDLGNKLKSGGYNVGTVQRVAVFSPRGVSGRVTPVFSSTSGGLKVTGSSGTARISGGTFRSLLGLKSTLILHRVYGGIRLKYDALNCGPGRARSEEFTWKDLSGKERGRAQPFTHGRLFYNASTGKVFWVKSTILKAYDALRKAGHDLGLPRTDQLSVRGGAASYFDRGRIYSSSSAGTHGVYGAILKKYLELSGPSGVLGLPTSDEHSITGGRRTNFEHGYIVWNSTTGKTTHKVT